MWSKRPGVSRRWQFLNPRLQTGACDADGRNHRHRRGRHLRTVQHAPPTRSPLTSISSAANGRTAPPEPRLAGRADRGPTAHFDRKGPLMPTNPTSTTDDALMSLDHDGGSAASPVPEV